MLGGNLGSLLYGDVSVMEKNIGRCKEPMRYIGGISLCKSCNRDSQLAIIDNRFQLYLKDINVSVFYHLDMYSSCSFFAFVHNPNSNLLFMSLTCVPKA